MSQPYTRMFGNRVGTFLYAQSMKGGWVYWWMIDGKRFGEVRYDSRPTEG